MFHCFFFLCGQNPATMYSLYRTWNTTQLYYEYIGIMIITNKPLEGSRKMKQPVIFVNITSGLKADFAHLIFHDFLGCSQRRWFQAAKVAQLLAADFRRFKRRGKHRSTEQFFFGVFHAGIRIDLNNPLHIQNVTCLGAVWLDRWNMPNIINHCFSLIRPAIKNKQAIS